MEVDGGGVDLVGLLCSALLVNLVAALCAAAWRCACAPIQAGPLMQMPVFLILFMAPVYVPLALLTGWIHAVASVNPATALLEAGRGLIAGGPGDVALALRVRCRSGVAFAMWAVRGLRSAERAG